MSTSDADRQLNRGLLFNELEPLLELSRRVRYASLTLLVGVFTSTVLAALASGNFFVDAAIGQSVVLMVQFAAFQQAIGKLGLDVYIATRPANLGSVDISLSSYLPKLLFLSAALAIISSVAMRLDNVSVYLMIAMIPDSLATIRSSVVFRRGGGIAPIIGSLSYILIVALGTVVIAKFYPSAQSFAFLLVFAGVIRFLSLWSRQIPETLLAPPVALLGFLAIQQVLNFVFYKGDQLIALAGFGLQPAVLGEMAYWGRVVDFASSLTTILATTLFPVLLDRERTSESQRLKRRVYALLSANCLLVLVLILAFWRFAPATATVMIGISYSIAAVLNLGTYMFVWSHLRDERYLALSAKYVVSLLLAGALVLAIHWGTARSPGWYLLPAVSSLLFILLNIVERKQSLPSSRAV